MTGLIVVLEEEEALELARPRTRADCEHGWRPCPFVGCRYNLYLDVSPFNGKISYSSKGEPCDMADSCALDVAERGGMTLEAIGDILDVTRERVRQIEITAMAKFHRAWCHLVEEEPLSDHIASKATCPTCGSVKNLAAYQCGQCTKERLANERARSDSVQQEARVLPRPVEEDPEGDRG